NADRRVQLVAIAHTQDELAIGVDKEVAVARVADAVADGVQNLYLKKTLALDADIELPIGVFQTARRQIELRVADLHAQADEDSRGGDVSRGVGGAGGLEGQIHQVFEIHTAAFEGGGFGVGQIVGHHVDARGEGSEASCCRIQCLYR